MHVEDVKKVPLENKTRSNGAAWIASILNFM